MRPERTLTAALFFVLLLCSLLFSDKIVEKLSITGYIFSKASQSKNLEIVTKEDIAELNISSFAELFSFLTSINVNRRGAGDTSLDFTLRGSNFEQVLIMVNGIPFNNPQTGHFNGDFPFTVGDIDRIEVLKGGSSAIYGGGAFAGIVNIILTHRESLKFSLTGGEKNFLSGYIAGGRKFSDLTLRISARKSRTSGYYTGREYDLFNLFANSYYTKGPTSINFSAGYLFKDLGARGFYAPYPSKETIKSAIFQLQATFKTKKVDYLLKLAHDLHHDYFVLDRERVDFYSNRSDTTNQLAHFSASYTSRNFNAHAGGEIKKEKMDSSGMGNHSRSIPAIFLKLYYSLGRGGVDLGLRTDFSNLSESELTFYAGGHYSPDPRLMLKLGFGKSYRFPSFTEMYYDSPSNRGDPDLKPEISHYLEAVMSYFTGHQALSLTLFYRKQDNLIDWIKISPSDIWQAANLEINNLHGLEFSHQLTLKNTRIAFLAERIFSRNTGPEILSKYGLRFPDISIKMNLLQRLGKKLKFIAGYCFKRIYDTGEKAHYLNISFSWRIQKRVELSLKADNLLNSIIEEIPGVEVPGRWIYLSLSYR